MVAYSPPKEIKNYTEITFIKTSVVSAARMVKLEDFILIGSLLAQPGVKAVKYQGGVQVSESLLSRYKLRYEILESETILLKWLKKVAKREKATKKATK